MSFPSLFAYLQHSQIRRTFVLTVVCCTVLLWLVPPIIGWVGGSIIGALLAPVLAQHAVLFVFTQQGLRALGTLTLIAGIDFLFLFMTYTAINTVFERGGTWKDRVSITLRALKGLLAWQLIIYAAFLLFFGKKPTVYIYSVIPPFLTQSGIASFYMMLWEISLLLYAFGYALMKDRVKALLAGGVIGINNFLMLFVLAGACVIITWLPRLCLSIFHAPTWVLILVGVTVHTLFFNILLYVFLRQDDLIEMFTTSPK